MSARSDLAGKRFGRLQVIACAGSERGRSKWACKCDCGADIEVIGKSLTSGNTTSCGCRQSEVRLSNGHGNLKHGHAKSGSAPSSPTYNTWFSMKSRCEHERDRMHHAYGAAGIQVCERWQKFENFLADMGERPAGTTLDRIENGKGYFKENCKWSTPKEQGQNKKNTHRFPYQSETLTITDIADRWGIPRDKVKYRLVEKGLTVEQLLELYPSTSPSTPR